MPASDYAQAFEDFLACTQEKSQLLAYASHLLQQRGSTSLLDIGPGNGDMSIPLSRIVPDYYGVEPIADYALALQKQGLSVQHATFPIAIERSFEAILASHVLALDDTPLEPFVGAAWKLLAAKGMLIIVTHQGADKDWLKLTKVLANDNLPYHRAVYEKVVQLLSAYAPVYRHTIMTTIESDSVDRVVNALGFVWSDGQSARWQLFNRHQEKLATLLASDYRQGRRIIFPFEQTFLVAHKP